MTHQTLNARRFITTPAQAEEVQKRQREISKMSDNLKIAQAEAIPNQRVKRVSSIDVGIFNVIDEKTFNQLWDQIK